MGILGCPHLALPRVSLLFSRSELEYSRRVEYLRLAHCVDDVDLVGQDGHGSLGRAQRRIGQHSVQLGSRHWESFAVRRVCGRKMLSKLLLFFFQYDLLFTNYENDGVDGVVVVPPDPPLLAVSAQVQRCQLERLSSVAGADTVTSVKKITTAMTAAAADNK